MGNNAKQNFAKWNAKYEALTPFLLLINGTYLDRPVVTKATRKYYFGSDSNPITSGQLQQITEVRNNGSNTFVFLICQNPYLVSFKQEQCSNVRC